MLPNSTKQKLTEFQEFEEHEFRICCQIQQYKGRMNSKSLKNMNSGFVAKFNKIKAEWIPRVWRTWIPDLLPNSIRQKPNEFQEFEENEFQICYQIKQDKKRLNSKSLKKMNQTTKSNPINFCSALVTMHLTKTKQKNLINRSEWKKNILGKLDELNLMKDLQVNKTLFWGYRGRQQDEDLNCPIILMEDWPSGVPTTKKNVFDRIQISFNAPVLTSEDNSVRC